VAADTGNTTLDNSNSIIDSPAETAPQVFVWNWYWNCATEEALPAVPAPPAGATTIVLNWHWDCADPPPPLDVSDVMVCTSCNIAISVRVGSPGDTGDVTQTIANQAAAVATGAAQSVQDASQAVQAVFEPTVGPLPPILPSMPWVAPPMRAAAVAFLAPAVPFEAGVLFDGPPGDHSAEDPPRHGAPSSFGAPEPPEAAAHGVAGRSTTLHAGRSDLIPPQRSSAGGVGSRGSAAARRPARAPAPPIAPPSEPTPFVLAAGAPAAHGDGPGAVVAFAAALTLAFLYAIYSALRTGPAVPPARDSGANPHPPG
jgi:hypothetical protein